MTSSHRSAFLLWSSGVSKISSSLFPQEKNTPPEFPALAWSHSISADIFLRPKKLRSLYPPSWPFLTPPRLQASEQAAQNRHRSKFGVAPESCAARKLRRFREFYRCRMQTRRAKALVGFRAASHLHKKRGHPAKRRVSRLELSLCLIQADEMTYNIHDAAPEARHNLAQHGLRRACALKGKCWVSKRKDSFLAAAGPRAAKRRASIHGYNCD
jgi:hypothetical protein